MYTDIHKCIQTYIHISRHIKIQRYRHTNKHIRMLIQTYMYIQSYILTYTQNDRQENIQRYKRTYRQTTIQTDGLGRTSGNVQYPAEYSKHLLQYLVISRISGQWISIISRISGIRLNKYLVQTQFLHKISPRRQPDFEIIYRNIICAVTTYLSIFLFFVFFFALKDIIVLV